MLIKSRSTPKSGFVESEEEQEEDDNAGTKTASNGGKSEGKQASQKKAVTSDSETEKTESGSETATGSKGK